MVYGIVDRSSEGVLKVKDCDTCRLCKACSVDDMHLKMWADYGMGCPCWAPRGPWHN